MGELQTAKNAEEDRGGPTFRGTAVMGLSICLGAFLSFLNQWLLAAQYGPKVYGAFSVSWSAAQFLLPFSVAGIPRFLLHRFKTRPYSAHYWLSPAFVLLVCGAVACSSLLSAWAVYIAPSHISCETGLWFACWILLMAPVVTVYMIFQMEQRLLFLALWPLLQIAGRTVVVFGAIFREYSISEVAKGFTLMLFPLALFALVTLMRFWRAQSADSSRLSGALPFQSRGLVLRHTLPYGLSEILDKVEFKIAVPLTAYIVGIEAAGLLSVAINILVGLYLVPSAVFQRYCLPYLHAWSVNAPDRKRVFLLKSVLLLAGAGSLAGAMLWWKAFFVVNTLFGPEYVASVPLLKILAWAIPVWLVSTALVHMFLSVAETVRLVALQLFGASAMIFILMGLAGEMGAAASAHALLWGRLLLVALSSLIVIKMLWRV